MEATILAWAVGVPAFGLPVTLLAALEGPVIIMENIHRLLTVSVWEFMQNPEKAVEDALGQPVAVLSDNRVVFYAVSPELMAQMTDMYDEPLLAMLVASRLKSVSRAVRQLHRLAALHETPLFNRCRVERLDKPILKFDKMVENVPG